MDDQGAELFYARVLNIVDLPPGAKKAVNVEGRSILLCNVNGQIHAISNICSHAAEELERGRISRGWISCPAHGARFELATGRPLNPPAVRPIAVFGVRIVDGWIEAAVINPA